MHPLAKDHTGKTYNRLTGVRPTEERKGGFIVWVWLCECGQEFKCPAPYVSNGNTKSCGCLYRETVGKSSLKHGLTNHRLHGIWKGIRKRCLNKNSKSYKNYGARGISICAEWNDFKRFYDWAIFNGYSDCLTIERKDVNKGYNPENCCWITLESQSYNRTSSKLTEDQARTIKNDPRPNKHVAKDYNISDVMVSRIKRGQSWPHV